MAALVITLSLLPGIAWGQQSSSFVMEESAINAGGHPGEGLPMASASFRLTLGAVGQGLSPVALAGPSFRMEGGFVSAYPPPGEVAGVRFLDESTLVWEADRAAGTYNIYQTSLTTPFDPGYGACQQSGIPTEGVTVTAAPAPGDAIFVLVTSKSRLHEEGTKGSTSAGAERSNLNPCP